MSIKYIAFNILISIFSNAYPQNLKTIDTVYYLADTAKVPLKDRLVEIGVEGPFKYYIIKCACLAYNQNPIFISKTADPSKTVNIASFKKIELISLVKLIQLAKDNGGNVFNDKHIAYILEPFEKSYTKRKVILAKPMRHDITY